MKTANSIMVRKSRERGHVNHGWLDSYFSFSFAEYHDPRYMGYRSLRVINEDRIEAGRGFGTHPHRDMEIISYVIEGELSHKDSMGTGSVLKAGNLQRMSAGTGVEHSEFNPSPTKPTHLLQIWILPEKKGLTPSYQELSLKDMPKTNGLTLVAANEEKSGVLKVHQDVRLYLGRLKKDETARYALAKARGAWIQMIKGDVDMNGTKLAQGDGAAVEGDQDISINASQGAEFLLFDLK